ncbi:MAG TPA: hypothetical protein PL185_01350 [Flavobacteriales bacterium]|jgi:uncharacterized protein (TIGR00661 family)|nr:hypothetical protein [Flavobacteriales bacterium]HPH81188.1 hypothetical protein [Flavobacteriales bacterium]
MSHSDSPRILVAPLDWGLGHAARCIPVIRELQNQGAQVIILGSPRVLAYLNVHISNLEQIPSNDTGVKYSSWLPAWLKILLQANIIKRSIQDEYTNLQSLIKIHQIDAIVSDNRYGLYAKSIPSILITHQVQPLTPRFLRFTQAFSNKRFLQLLKPFSEIWIPDLDSNKISGRLAHVFSDSISVKNVGLLSRFGANLPPIKSSNSILAIISGPEPQRSIFFQEIVRLQNAFFADTSIICENFPDKVSAASLENIRIILQPNDEQFIQEIERTQHLICRSGYSSIMDFIRLNRTALLIPTPGQTEQEYLSERCQKLGFTQATQRQLKDIKTNAELEVLFPSAKSPDLIISNEPEYSKAALKKAIESLLSRIASHAKD